VKYTAEVWGGPHDGKTYTSSSPYLLIPIPVSVSFKDIDLENPISPRIECEHYIWALRSDNTHCWVKEDVHKRLVS
jgi:hypothetical protein